MDSLVVPDPTRVPEGEPTHYHCYEWEASGAHWHEVGKTDSLDFNSPNRPPIRTREWLNKSPSLIKATFEDPVEAARWLVDRWEAWVPNALNPVPDWVGVGRQERALVAVRGGNWPTYSLYLKGGMYVTAAVVGTDKQCH